MNVELQRIWMETRNTVMFVTHGIAEAVFLGDEVMVFSPRPGRVLETIRIDLPRPRDVSEIRLTPEFSELHRKIWDAMKNEVLKAYAGRTH